MARSEILVRQAAEIADDVTTRIRNRGFLRAVAIKAAAAALGVTARRIQALVWDQGPRVAAGELEALRDRYAVFLAAEARELERQAAKVREQLRTLEESRAATVQGIAEAGTGADRTRVAARRNGSPARGRGGFVGCAPAAARG